MENPMDSKIAFRVDEGKGICFFFHPHNRPSWGQCELFFDSTGRTKVFLENTFPDSEVSFGQLTVLSRELAIDINECQVQIDLAKGDSSDHHVIPFPIMVEDLRQLCKWVNAHFIQLARTHLNIAHKGCTVKNASVVNTSTSPCQEIPYRLLIEMELNSYLNRMSKPPIL